MFGCGFFIFLVPPICRQQTMHHKRYPFFDFFHTQVSRLSLVEEGDRCACQGGCQSPSRGRFKSPQFVLLATVAAHTSELEARTLEKKIRIEELLWPAGFRRSGELFVP